MAKRAIRLLVVEDNEAYLYLIQKAFERRSGGVLWNLQAVPNGEDAVRVLFDEEMARNPLPDMILLDWKLPKISGNEVLRRIKEDRLLRKIPVLVFSSSEDQQDVHAAYGDHANGYITKPASGDVLGEIVETIEEFWTSVATLARVAR